MSRDLPNTSFEDAAAAYERELARHASALVAARSGGDKVIREWAKLSEYMEEAIALPARWEWEDWAEEFRVTFPFINPMTGQREMVTLERSAARRDRPAPREGLNYTDVWGNIVWEFWFYWDDAAAVYQPCCPNTAAPHAAGCPRADQPGRFGNP